MEHKRIKNRKYILYLLFPVALILFSGKVFSQGSGGPQALPNAFAGGPPPPPGGGGGGGPVQPVPLDTDAIFILVIAGITYLVFHHRRKWLIQKNVSSEHDQ